MVALSTPSAAAAAFSDNRASTGSYRDGQPVGNRDDQRLVDLLRCDDAGGGQRSHGFAAERAFARIVGEFHHLVRHTRIDQSRKRRRRSP